MKLHKGSVIRYILRDKDDEEVMLTFTLEQIEGSVPNFYQALKDCLVDLEDFDLDSSEIVSREVLNEEDL